MLPQIRFDLAKLIHYLAVAVMTVLSTSSLNAFFSWPLSVVLALVLSYTFTRMVAIAAGVDSSAPMTLSPRLVAGAAALFLGSVTVGLSSTTLYRGSMGKASGVAEILRQRELAIQGIDRAIADARAAQASLRVWSESSATAARKEAATGGTCPNRARTAGSRGPVAMFREADASIARQINSNLVDAIKPLELARARIPVEAASEWQNAVAELQSLNSAAAAANAVYGGAAITAVATTLDARLGATLDGGVPCGDPARDEAIRAARAAVGTLLAAEKLPEIRPAVDLASPEASVQRGLLRAINAAALIATLGLVGSFADDELMTAALRKNGVVNTETLAIWIALIVEVAVVGSSIIAGWSTRGRLPVFPLNPTTLVDQLRARKGLRWQAAAGVAAGAVNLVAVGGPAPMVAAAPSSGVGRDSRESEPVWSPAPVPVYDASIMNTARFVKPCIIPGTDRILIPEDAPVQILAAARSLAFRGAAKVRGTFEGTDAKTDSLAPLRGVMPGKRYILLELRPEFAEAMRAEFLHDTMAGGTR